MRLIDADKLIGDLHNHAFLEGDDREIVYSVIQQQPTFGGWISVKDRLPPELHSMWFPLYGTSKWKSAMWREESDHVLVTVVFDDGTRYVSMGRTHDGEWNTNISKVVHHAVTHWMPLPEPPEVNTDA